MSNASRVILILCVILIASGSALTANSDKSAELAGLLANARTLESLRSEPAAPFLLRASLTASLSKGKASGEYVLGWADSNQWREVMVLADFRRVREGAAGGYNQVRSLDFQPQIIFDIDDAIDVDSILRLFPTETLSKAPKHKTNGVNLDCVLVNVKEYFNRELCFDPSSGLLTHAELRSFGTPENARQVIDYSDFLNLGAHKFPSKFKLLSKAGYSLEISVTQLNPLTASPNLTSTGDPQAEFWRSCREAPRPVLEQEAPPHYPQESKLNGEQGAVVVCARVEADGSLSHLKVLQSPSPALQQATLDALRSWKYKPRVCGSVPVREEMLIQVEYALRG